MVKLRKGFTLLELLISVTLMGIIILPLYSSVSLLKESNTQIKEHLIKDKEYSKMSNTLFLDILSSDRNISIRRSDFASICIEHTNNSLYGLSDAKVCWGVEKENKSLVRIEGSDFSLPLNDDALIETDTLLSNIELFDVIRSKKNIMVVIKQNKQKATSFLIQGMEKKKKPKKKPKKPKKNTKQKKNVKPKKNTPPQRGTEP